MSTTEAEAVQLANVAADTQLHTNVVDDAARRVSPFGKASRVAQSVEEPAY